MEGLSNASRSESRKGSISQNNRRIGRGLSLRPKLVCSDQVAASSEGSDAGGCCVMDENTSLINIGELSRPATVLVEKISDAVGGIFKPYQIVRVAKDESYSEPLLLQLLLRRIWPAHGAA